jgi:hypothetical protein
MNLICPVCKFEIPEKLIDLSEESAFCPHCQKDFDCSQWMEKKLVSPENLQPPPNGAWFEKSASGFKVHASTRSYKWLLFTPVASVWSVLLFIFSWAILSHVNQQMRLILFLFLAPFYLLGLFFWSCALMSICGKVEIEVDGDSGTIFKGIGAMGWKRRFDWNQIKKIRISKYYYPSGNRKSEQQITFEGEKVVSFAKGIKAERVRFMLIALRLMHRNKT